MYSPFGKPTVWTLKKEIRELKEEIINLKVEFDNFENGLANRINNLINRGKLNVVKPPNIFRPAGGITPPKLEEKLDG